MADFKVQFSGGSAFEAKFDGNDKPNFKASMGEVHVVDMGGAPYEGEYVITPKVEAQILPTAKKTMKDDVTVKAIPVFNTGNAAGGSTFYIATMDEDPEGAILILDKAKLGTAVL